MKALRVVDLPASCEKCGYLICNWLKEGVLSGVYTYSCELLEGAVVGSPVDVKTRSSLCPLLIVDDGIVDLLENVMRLPEDEQKKLCESVKKMIARG